MAVAATGSNIYFWKTRPELDPWRAFRASRATFQKCPFSFCWEVNLLTVSARIDFFEIERFCGDGRWSMCCPVFLIVFRGLRFAKQWGEYAIKTNCFLTIPKLVSSKSNEEMMPKTWFREVNFEVHVDQFWKKSLTFFNNCAFGKCVWIECVHECSELMETQTCAF